MTYKITFNMISPVVYTTLPIFDSILAYAKYCMIRKISDFKTPHGDEINEIELPLNKHRDYDFYLASYMFSDHSEEGLDAWRKRWDVRHDSIANFGKAKRKINTASGEFKSFDIPLVTHSAKRIWFYFEGDAVQVTQIIQNLNGIGKKTTIGFGWFNHFEITKSQENYTLYRPLPINFAKTNINEISGIDMIKSFGAWKMPYWVAKNQKEIIIPLMVITN